MAMKVTSTANCDWVMPLSPWKLDWSGIEIRNKVWNAKVNRVSSIKWPLNLDAKDLVATHIDVVKK